MSRPRVMAVVLVAALGTVGCAADAPVTDPPTPTADPGDVSPAPSPDDEPSAETSPSPTPTELAGEVYDGPPLGGFPAALDVIGVAADDVLNVRAGPGVDAEVVATLAPLATDVAATGAARLLPGSIWLEVEVDGTTGWANSSFFAFLGSTDDITARIVEDEERPRAATLEELAQLVAARVASQEPASRIVISDGPSVGDLGEVTVDVVGLGDDAAAGLRLVVFATVEADGFTLRTVERTVLCGRGVTDDGICV